MWSRLSGDQLHIAGCSAARLPLVGCVLSSRLWAVCSPIPLNWQWGRRRNADPAEGERHSVRPCCLPGMTLSARLRVTHDAIGAGGPSSANQKVLRDQAIRVDASTISADGGIRCYCCDGGFRESGKSRR